MIVLDDESWHPEASLKDVKERTGFVFDAERARPTAPPTKREIEALRSLDPDGRFERDAAVDLSLGRRRS